MNGRRILFVIGLGLTWGGLNAFSQAPPAATPAAPAADTAQPKGPVTYYGEPAPAPPTTPTVPPAQPLPTQLQDQQPRQDPFAGAPPPTNMPAPQALEQDQAEEQNEENIPLPFDGPSLDQTVDLKNNDFIYDPTGRRDPFIAPQDQKNALEDQGPPAESLELYELSQLRLVGIISGVNEPKGMIRSPTGKVFMVKKNSKVGRNKGFVAAVREGEIVVFELSQDGKTPSTRIITLQK